jgi:predicted PhzF superfamily epimerase YddE/YHI9
MYFVADGEDENGAKKYRTRMMVDGTEDAGTGSASCALGCWLASRENAGIRKGPFKYAFMQGVEMGRRNYIAVEVVKNDEGSQIQTVALIWTAVTAMEGSIEV